ncbi:MAG: hypothetical protein U5L96_03140 [Owenweeksia sp.]|nr:hypothetical protein [Owenweeksia sp.]
MYGATINKLEVYAEDQNGTRVLIDSIMGQQQTAGSDSFRVRNVPLVPVSFANYRIVFEGFIGSSFTGDISIDEVSIIDLGGCIFPSGLKTKTLGCDSASIQWNSVSGSSILVYGPVDLTHKMLA